MSQLIAFQIIQTLIIIFLIYLIWKNRSKKNELKIAKLNSQLETLMLSSSHSKKQLESTFDTIEEGIAVIDSDYNIIKTNPSYNKLINKPRNEILLQKCYKLLRNLDYPCPECPILNSHYHEGFLTKVNEKKIQINVKISKSGPLKNYIETLQDVSKFEDLHAKLRRSERLASMGTMVAGIAHEINNPLTSISGNSQLMTRTPEKYGLNKKGLDRINTIFESVEKATKIVNELLYLSKPSQLKFRKIKLKSLIEDSLAKFEPIEKSGIDFELKLNNNSSKIWGYKIQIESVISRVTKNAIQAINEKKIKKINHKGKIIYESSENDLNVTLDIIDNGISVSDDDISQVFDPFYTTKEPGAGAGLGLSLCHRIMLEHSGSINLYKHEMGAKIQLIFPKDRPNES